MHWQYPLRKICNPLPSAEVVPVIQHRLIQPVTALFLQNRNHLHNLIDNTRIRFKIYVDINKPDVFTATRLFEAANWLERETYDFYGVNFVGHPNLVRILNVDEMDYFPMRKEYPLEDQTRKDKDDEMFGRGGSAGYGTVKTDADTTVAESEKDNVGDKLI